MGKKFHNDITSHRLLKEDVIHGTALVHMYAKCGVLQKAQKVLEELSFSNVVSSNALSAGDAQQGHSQEALPIYQKGKHRLQLTMQSAHEDNVEMTKMYKLRRSSSAVCQFQKSFEDLALKDLDKPQLRSSLSAKERRKLKQERKEQRTKSREEI
ncbi:hypothetical protein L7F22_013059 [Adiantum nelumboides]|nr:hypothetical protein [Adiantum nelumboides]